jgi:hypothetical protein
MSRSYTLSPPRAFVACSGAALAVRWPEEEPLRLPVIEHQPLQDHFTDSASARDSSLPEIDDREMTASTAGPSCWRTPFTTVLWFRSHA